MPEWFEQTTRTSQLEGKKVWNELRGNWQQDNRFFRRFFPANAHVRKTWSKAKPTLYNASNTKPRWLGLPQEPKLLGPRLYTALTDLLNAILGYLMPNYNKQHPRLFIRTYRRKVLPNLDRSIWPAILLAGAGSSFVNRTTVRPIADYGSAISPFEVVLENVDMELARKRLAIIIQEIFYHQPNRRYIFGLIISPSTVTCYLFDHSGVVCSPPLHYHKYPEQFCALIAGIASINEAAIGLDNSVYTDTRARGRIWTRDPKRKHAPFIAYYVDGMLYHAPSIIGRGTICFMAHHGDPKKPYVIKDAWISADDPELEGRESEGFLLLHAKSKGVVRGVTQLCHSEEVRLQGSNGKLFVDDIYHIRRLKRSEHSQVQQRVHTRIVMSTYGKPLEDFSSRKELLFAYYDALRAHRNLYEIAGILHRDIKPGNILINPDGEEGDRGILIDFDHAIRIDNMSPYSTRKKIGTYLFMSSNVIQGNGRHDYLDDLESFYYVLVYILTMFEGPQSPTRKVPDSIEEWGGQSAWRIKEGDFLLPYLPFKPQPWFGNAFATLLGRLHTLFAQRLEATLLALRAKKTPPPPDSIGESDKFLSYVRQAIAELDREEANRDQQEHLHGPISQSNDVKISHSLPMKRIKRNDGPTMASSRSLRANVNYGRHRKYRELRVSNSVIYSPRKY